MRTGFLTCAAIAGAALIGQTPSRAQPGDPAPPASENGPAASFGATALSGVDVVVKKPQPTALSGVDVVAKKSTKLSEVVVSPSKCPKAADPPDEDVPAPKLVSTFPEKGAVVRPGLVVLRLTFDRPMTCDGLLDHYTSLVDPCPPPLQEPMISRDRRTFLTVCKLDGKKHFGLWLKGFKSLAGHEVAPTDLVFNTSETAEVASIDEAIAEDRWLQPAPKAR